MPIVPPVEYLFIVLMIGGLILVHELGHFLVARWMGVHVVEFAIGVGPRVFAWKGKKTHDDLPPTEYVLGLLPFGGYVKMLGYDPSEDAPDTNHALAFPNKAVWRRFLIMVAGPAFNLILPFFLFFFVGLSQSQLVGSTVGSVDPDWPAWQAGLRPGDRIVGLDGEKVDYFWQLQSALEGRAGEAVPVTFERLGEIHSVVVTPVTSVNNIVPGVLEQSKGRIGVGPTFPLPLVGVKEGSIAALAGITNWDRIVAVNGVRMEVLHLALAAIERDAGKPVELKLLSYNPLRMEGLQLAVAKPKSVTLPASSEAPLRGLFSAECLVHEVLPGSPAEVLGIKPGDRIVQLDDRQCASWRFASMYLHTNREKAVKLTWVRGTETLAGMLTHAKLVWPNQFDQGAERLVHGIRVQHEEQDTALVANEDRLGYASYRMFQSTRDAIFGTVAMLGGLFSGKVSVKDGLGGPLMIGQLAAEAGKAGWDKFFALMAGISVSLGLINLLPIPLLDGGQILFLAIEGVRRKPVSVRIRMIATYLGLAFIIVLMVIVLRNDISRIWGG